MKPAPFLVVALLAGILSACGSKDSATPAAPQATAIAPTNAPPPAPQAGAAFETLKGQWRRPDGGYILEIRNVEAGGKVEAHYFNPRPINVAKAEASQSADGVKVLVELRDVNYPGSTYTLTYDARHDRLQGEYFQAALNQTFDVAFVREGR